MVDALENGVIQELEADYYHPIVGGTCYLYGSYNLCNGMTCDSDSKCFYSCCHEDYCDDVTACHPNLIWLWWLMGGLGMCFCIICCIVCVRQRNKKREA